MEGQEVVLEDVDMMMPEYKAFRYALEFVICDNEWACRIRRSWAEYYSTMVGGLSRISIVLTRRICWGLMFNV